MSKELQELNGWKVGQKVIFYYPAPSSKRVISTIQRITDGRNGTIYVDKCDKLFDIHGHARGSGITNYFIKPATHELIEIVTKEIRKEKLQHFDFSSLTPDQASTIVIQMRQMGISI